MLSIYQEKKLSILIVDDDLRMRESLRELMTMYNMATTLAEDGLQALEYLKREFFDLVLLDIEMPKVNGLQVMREIHTHYPETHIIVLSGNATFENARKVLRMGAEDFLSKPYDPAELLKLLNHLVEQKNNQVQDSESKQQTVVFSGVEKTLMELEEIIRTEDLNLTNKIINSSPAVAFLWRNVSSWPVQFVSRNVIDLLGYSANEFVTNKVIYRNIIHPEDRARVIDEVVADDKTTRFQHKPYRIITKSGVVKWVDDCSSIVRNAQRIITHYQGVIIDVTERELHRQNMLKKQMALEHVAHHDALTGLPNRLLLRDRLQQSIKKAQRIKKHLAVLYIDLDKFKPINDTLGHDAGDEVLIAVAKRLTKSVRAMDTIARIGGDEFIVLMESVTNVQDVKAMAEKLNKSLKEPIHWEMHELFITSSIGISLSPDDADCAEDLMKKADMAMYQSKENGRNTFQFYSA